VKEKRLSFKVDIASIIAIMGQSIYSRLETPVRELIQNAHDAIVRRRQIDLSFRGRIDVIQIPERQTLRFCDDGIGLTPDEAENYLGTLGVGITGLLKGRGPQDDQQLVTGSGSGLIGQFGIGLFSGFMLADEIVVDSLSTRQHEAIRWSAGAGTEILLSPSNHSKQGTAVELRLKDEHKILCEDQELLEKAIKEFADFIDIPIHVNGASARVNLIQAAWFEQTPDPENLEAELASYFDEQPLDVVSIRCEKPVPVAGAIYISPQRTPGFGDDPVVAVTVRRMVISRHIDGLLPAWGSFFRGVLELQDCAPTASREDLVRDASFEAVQKLLENYLFEHFEEQAVKDPQRLEAIVDIHRYTFAGAAHDSERLRRLLHQSYKWSTSKGRLTFDEIMRNSHADPLFEMEADTVVWFNADRRQERWIDSVFSNQQTVCVHATRSFEETLLALMVGDVTDLRVDLRMASLAAPNFATSILGLSDLEDADETWQKFFQDTEADVKIGDLDSNQPVIAFLNERYELFQSIEEMKKDGEIPLGFQRLINSHFEQSPAGRNEVVLNRKHRLVRSTLKTNTSHPMASVLRIIVINALLSAGATIGSRMQKQERDDLDWIAEVLSQLD